MWKTRWCGFIIHNTQLSEIPVNNLITFQQLARCPSQSQNGCLLSHLMTERSFASVILIQKHQHVTCTECFMQSVLKEAGGFHSHHTSWSHLCLIEAVLLSCTGLISTLNMRASGYQPKQVRSHWVPDSAALVALSASEGCDSSFKLYYSVYLGLFCSEITTGIMSGGPEQH